MIKLLLYELTINKNLSKIYRLIKILIKDDFPYIISHIKVKLYSKKSNYCYCHIHFYMFEMKIIEKAYI